jgi:anti-sigma regulatory factor (Ser/Thr protein kinase)
VNSPRQLELKITSDPANLAPVRRELEGFCAECGFVDSARGEIVLSVNEALTNITRHAYGGAIDRPIHLRLTFADGTLRIALRDWGNGKLPEARPSCREPLKPGGVGLLCLRELMDRIEFEPQPDGMQLIMERRL